MFVCSPSKSHAPRRPSDSQNEDGFPEDSQPETLDEFLLYERKRAIQQILGSNGFFDVRDIKEVRRVQPSKPTVREPIRTGWESQDDGWESLSEDEEDEGGEATLKGVHAHEQKNLRTKRMFEIEFTSGERHVFEVSLTGLLCSFLRVLSKA